MRQVNTNSWNGSEFFELKPGPYLHGLLRLCGLLQGGWSTGWPASTSATASAGQHAPTRKEAPQGSTHVKVWLACNWQGFLPRLQSLDLGWSGALHSLRSTKARTSLVGPETVRMMLFNSWILLCRGTLECTRARSSSPGTGAGRVGTRTCSCLTLALRCGSEQGK
ncbi:unnamed protein product [Effrenium voratum]|nr:unnamed protein product [Effrenium voratum]